MFLSNRECEPAELLMTAHMEPFDDRTMEPLEDRGYGASS